MSDLPFREPPKYDPTLPGIVVGGRVDDVSITLRLFGAAIDPSEISSLLRAEPTSSCRKGDIFRGRRYDRIEKTGKWLYAQPHRQQDLDTVVRDFLSMFPNDLAIWDDLTARFSVDLFLGVWMRDWNRGFSLTPETLKLLSDRRLEVGFDIYCDTSQPDLDIQDVG